MIELYDIQSGVIAAALFLQLLSINIILVDSYNKRQEKKSIIERLVKQSTKTIEETPGPWLVTDKYALHENISNQVTREFSNNRNLEFVTATILLAVFLIFFKTEQSAFNFLLIYLVFAILVRFADYMKNHYVKKDIIKQVKEKI